ncbi:MAG: hypothetical protein AABW59_02605 [archaeon]
MNWGRAILITATLAITAWLVIQVEMWAEQYKSNFFYLDDWTGWIGVILFVFALTGIFKWLLKEEIILTRPRRKK